MVDEKNYTQGFNQGYKLMKYSPDIFDMIHDTLSNDNEWQRGLLEGAEQAKKEKEQERLAELESLRGEQQQSKEQEGLEL